LHGGNGDALVLLLPAPRAALSAKAGARRRAEAIEYRRPKHPEGMLASDDKRGKKRPTE